MGTAIGTCIVIFILYRWHCVESFEIRCEAEKCKNAQSSSKIEHQARNMWKVIYSVVIQRLNHRLLNVTSKILESIDKSIFIIVIYFTQIIPIHIICVYYLKIIYDFRLLKLRTVLVIIKIMITQSTCFFNSLGVWNHNNNNNDKNKNYKNSRQSCVIYLFYTQWTQKLKFF